MVVLGLALGAAVGAVYGAVVGSLGGGGAGFVVGFVYGCVYGAVPGLVLGALDGLLLGVVTRTYYRHRPTDAHRYPGVAGWACAVASLLGLLAFVFSLYDPSAGVRADDLMRFWAVPVLAATSASWWAGRKVAGWYARGF